MCVFLIWEYIWKLWKAQTNTPHVEFWFVNPKTAEIIKIRIKYKATSEQSVSVLLLLLLSFYPGALLIVMKLILDIDLCFVFQMWVYIFACFLYLQLISKYLHTKKEKKTAACFSNSLDKGYLECFCWTQYIAVEMECIMFRNEQRKTKNEKKKSWHTNIDMFSRVAHGY